MALLLNKRRLLLAKQSPSGLQAISWLARVRHGSSDAGYYVTIISQAVNQQLAPNCAILSGLGFRSAAAAQLRRLLSLPVVAHGYSNFMKPQKAALIPQAFPAGSVVSFSPQSNFELNRFSPLSDWLTPTAFPVYQISFNQSWRHPQLACGTDPYALVLIQLDQFVKTTVQFVTPSCPLG